MWQNARVALDISAANAAFCENYLTNHVDDILLVVNAIDILTIQIRKDNSMIEISRYIKVVVKYIVYI